LVGGLAGDRPPSEPPVALVVVGEEGRQPVHRILADLVEELSRVSIADVARPAAGTG
jgi:hypothetical protein